MNKDNRKNILYLMLILILLLVSMLTLAGTFAKYIHEAVRTDSAVAAGFDIEIFAPQELDVVSQEKPFEYSFSGQGQTISFDFRITNHREVDVICAPYVEGDVNYTVFIEKEKIEKFIVEVGDTVDFQVVILSDGLVKDVLSTNLIINIEQYMIGK